MKFLIAASLLLLCISNGTSGKLVGKVVSHESQQALIKAQITIYPNNVVIFTDSLGNYEMSCVLAGFYEVGALADGYCTIRVKNVRILPDFITRLDFELLPDTCKSIVIENSRPLLKNDSLTLWDSLKKLSIEPFPATNPLGGHWLFRDSTGGDTTKQKY